MSEFKLSKHQVIARELFGESKETYEMERADLYQRLSSLMIGSIAGSSNDSRMRAYRLGYKAQVADALANNDEFLVSFARTVQLMQPE